MFTTGAVAVDNPTRVTGKDGVDARIPTFVNGERANHTQLIAIRTGRDE